MIHSRAHENMLCSNTICGFEVNVLELCVDTGFPVFIFY